MTSSDTIVENPTHGDLNYAEKQRLATKGWQVVSVADNVPPSGVVKSDGYFQLTEGRRAMVVVNVYQPGQSDKMHCHPGSEHIFFVVQGELHIRGLDSDEDVVLKPGELVHVNASYYYQYQLANETDDVTVLYQVATKPIKPVKIARYVYRGPGDIDPTTLEG